MDHPKTVIEQLVSTKPETDHEFTFHTSEPVKEEDDLRELATIEAQSTVKYRDLCRLLNGFLGEPQFEGEPDDNDYPSWYSALRMSYWTNGKHFVYAAIRHDASFLPFVVVYGVTGLNSDLLSEGSTVHLTQDE